MEEQELSVWQMIKANKGNFSVGVAVVGLTASLIGFAVVGDLPGGRANGAQSYQGGQFAEEALSSRMMGKQLSAVAPSSAVMSVDSVSSFEASKPQPGRKIQETHSLDFVTSREGVRDLYNETLSLCTIDFCETVSADLSNYSRIKSANITLRVEHEHVRRVLQSIEDYEGEIALSNHSRSSMDRTMEFEDISARRKAQVALRDRLEELVRNYNYSITQDIGDLLAIEREIARVQSQIERMDARMRGISSVTDRVTMNISFRNEEAASPVEVPHIGNALKEVGDIFSRNVAKVITGAAAAIPSLVALIVFLFAMKHVLRVLLRNRKRA